MKKLMTVLAIAAVLLATVGAGTAAASKYKTKGAAGARMVQLAYWVAAINQGRWRSAGFVLQGPYGPSKGDPQWKGTVILFRRLNDHPSIQTCHIEVAINHSGETEHLTIHCEYALEFAPDRRSSAR